MNAFPAQEPFNENMAKYHDTLIERAKGLQPIEVNYGDDPYQSLGIFPAPKPDGRVLLYFHGGGWTNGYKEWMYFMAPALNALGITFVSGGYRLAPTHVFPTGFQDCARAVEWLVQNVSTWGGDPTQLFVSGHSAGGHYAALLAVTDEAIPGVPCAARLRGSAPLSGTYYFGENSGLAVRPRFLGPTERAAEKQASPFHHVRAGLPAFLLAWGDDDFPHLKRQAQEMAAALEQANVSVETLELPNCNHFTASFAAGEVGGKWPLAFDDWSARVVRGQP